MAVIGADEDWEVCERFSNLTMDVRQSQLDAMRSLINSRLVPLRPLSDDIVTAGLQQLVTGAPELYAIVGSCFGQDGQMPKQVRAPGGPVGATADM